MMTWKSFERSHYPLSASWLYAELVPGVMVWRSWSPGLIGCFKRVSLFRAFGFLDFEAVHWPHMTSLLCTIRIDIPVAVPFETTLAFY